MTVWIHLAACLPLTGIGYGQHVLSPEMVAELERIAPQDVPEGAPGIATAIVRNGAVEFAGYYGYANLEDSVRIDEASRFNIASNGKQFTALAIRILADEGRLSLDEEVGGYFPSLSLVAEKGITIQHLLTHTSGIRDVYDLWSFKGLTWWKHTFDNESAYQLLSQQNELNFAPGEEYMYSNSNYILLALLVEEVTGQSFQEYTDEMFRRLDMPNTGFESRYDDIEGAIADPYFNFGSWVTFDWKWNVVGDGNLFTTLKDQIRWEQLIQDTPEDHPFHAAIVASQQPIDDAVGEYGYGLEYNEYKGMPYRFHEGATGAWKATVLRVDSMDVSFITMTNSGKTIPANQTRQMVDVYYGIESNQEPIVTEPPTVGAFISEENITGIYLTPSNYAFEFLVDGEGKLQLNRAGRGNTEIERDSNNIFQQKYDPDFKQEFKVLDNGDMTVTAYYTTHQPYTLTKKQVDWEGFDYTALEGVFLNAETGVSIEIKYHTGQEYEVQRRGVNPSAGKLISRDIFLFDNYMATIVSPDELLLDFERVKRLKLVRVK
jgi:CubicO group peptidase (beta-lactamase class C family)